MILIFVEISSSISLKGQFQCYVTLPCPFGLSLEDLKNPKL